MTNLFIVKPFARIHQTHLENVNRNGVRAYRDSPETVQLQIRVASERIGRYASVRLTFDEARQLASHLMSETNFRRSND
jgi:hypothetical protein